MERKLSCSLLLRTYMQYADEELVEIGRYMTIEKFRSRVLSY